MAKKFNNGDSFQYIRTVLNDNADEIDANKTLATNAQKSAVQALTQATTLANGSNKKPGIVESSQYTYQPISSIEDLVNSSWLYFISGKGMPMAVPLQTFAFNQRYDNSFIPCLSLIYLLDGTMSTNGIDRSIPYLYGWRDGQLRGMMFITMTHKVIIDCDNGEIYTVEHGSTKFTQVAGGTGGGSDYTLPVATASVLGGVKRGTNVNIDATGVISVPTANASTAGVVKGSSTIQMDANGVASIPSSVTLPGQPKAGTTGISPEQALPFTSRLMAWEDYVESMRRVLFKPGEEPGFAPLICNTAISDVTAVGLRQINNGFFERLEAWIQPASPNHTLVIMYIDEIFGVQSKQLRISGLKAGQRYVVNVTGVYSVSFTYAVTVNELLYND